MSALGQKQTYAVQHGMSALLPKATKIADIMCFRFKRRLAPLLNEYGRNRFRFRGQRWTKLMRREFCRAGLRSFPRAISGGARGWRPISTVSLRRRAVRVLSDQMAHLLRAGKI